MNRRTFLYNFAGSAAYEALRPAWGQVGYDPLDPKRPSSFRPLKYPFSTQDLKARTSELTRRARAVNARVEKINREGRYQSTWESLDSHPLPDWFPDAKFGMLIDWGVYSVAAYSDSTYPDWYLNNMLYNPATKKYHDRVWGQDFERDDFISLFTASQYDPESLIHLARTAGMKYVVPFCKHHDGFCMWPSTFTLRNAGLLGPKRDLIGPIVKACRKQALHFGFYFSIDEWEYPILMDDGSLEVRTWNVTPMKLGSLPYSDSAWQGKINGKVPVKDFYNDYINPQAVEFIDRYDPDILWFDGDWVVDADHRNSRPVVAYFYNHAEGRKGVVVNDRIGLCRSIPDPGTVGQPHGDFYTSENRFKAGETVKIRHIWEELNSPSESFGFNAHTNNAAMQSATALVHLLLDIVSQGGNLMLVVNLTGTGALEPLVRERLVTIGSWLDVNGEAVYGTRQWKMPSQGKDVKFTQSKDARYVYAICLSWPGEALYIPSLHARPGSAIRLLGLDRTVTWSDDAVGGLTIRTPGELAEKSGNGIAWVFRVEQLHS